MRKCYRIGSLLLAVESDSPFESGGLFQAFCVAGAQVPDVLYRVTYVPKLPSHEHAVAFPGHLLLEQAGGVCRFYLDSRTQTPFACTQQRGSTVQIQILSSYYPWGSTVEQLFPLLALQHTLLRRAHLLLHGAFLTVNNSGLLFTGKSGIGKTTQSRLWQSGFGAKAVNEDRAVIDVSEHEIRVCGVPVAGSSPFCDNVTAALRAIIVLAQGPENRIERLSVAKAIPRLMDGVYLPLGFSADQTECMELVLRICTAVPVYRLECRPELESAELVYRTVFGGKEGCKIYT